MESLTFRIKRLVCYLLGGHRFEELRVAAVNIDSGEQFKVRTFTCKRCRHAFTQSTSKTWPAMGRRF